MFTVKNADFHHFKGGIYRGVGIAFKPDRLYYVLYQSYDTGEVWEREYTEFFEQVTTNLGTRPRFMPLQDGEPYTVQIDQAFWQLEAHPAMSLEPQTEIKPHAHRKGARLVTKEEYDQLTSIGALS